MRRAGVHLLQDAVAHRRHLVELLAVVGLIAICLGLAMRKFRGRCRTDAGEAWRSVGFELSRFGYESDNERVTTTSVQTMPT
jgi:hypothetical protein